MFMLLNILLYLVLMAQRLACRGWRSGGPWFKSHPGLTTQSWSSNQLNQLGSEATSDSTLKQLITCGVSNTCTLLYFYSTQTPESFNFHYNWTLRFTLIKKKRDYIMHSNLIFFKIIFVSSHIENPKGFQWL